MRCHFNLTALIYEINIVTSTSNNIMEKRGSGFRDMTPRHWVISSRWFGGNQCLHLQGVERSFQTFRPLKMTTMSSFETPGTDYRVTLSPGPEGVLNHTADETLNTGSTGATVIISTNQIKYNSRQVSNSHLYRHRTAILTCPSHKEMNSYNVFCTPSPNNTLRMELIRPVTKIIFLQSVPFNADVNRTSG